MLILITMYHVFYMVGMCCCDGEYYSMSMSVPIQSLNNNNKPDMI